MTLTKARLGCTVCVVYWTLLYHHQYWNLTQSELVTVVYRLTDKQDDNEWSGDDWPDSFPRPHPTASHQAEASEWPLGYCAWQGLGQGRLGQGQGQGGRGREWTCERECQYKLLIHYKQTPEIITVIIVYSAKQCDVTWCSDAPHHTPTHYPNHV